MQEVRFSDGTSIKELFEGENVEEVFKKMDSRLSTLMQDKKLVKVSRKQVGRNDKCPGGSGRKFKKCCMVGGRMHL